MKKFFEKHDLFKLASFVLLIAVILTWILKLSYFSSGELIEDVITRVGLYDLPVYVFEGIRYYYKTFLLIFAIGAFYKIMGSVDAYRVLVDKIAGIFKRKEKLFIALSIIIYAVLASIFTDYFVLLVFVPFTVAILTRFKVDKITGFVSSIGGILLGVLGSTYSTRIVGQVASSGSSSGALGVGYAYEITGVLVIAALAYIALLFFTFMRLDKNEKAEKLEDKFASEVVVDKKAKAKKKTNIIPGAIVLGLLALLIILGFVNWSEMGVEIFTKFHSNFIGDGTTGATLFGQPVFYYIFGQSLTEFGTWDVYGLITTLLIATFFIKVIYRVKLDDIFDEGSEGLKKVLNTNVLVLVILAVLLISVIYPTLPAIFDKIIGKGTNFAALYLTGIIDSIFTVDFMYTVALVGSGFTNLGNNTVAALILQSTYGLVSFIAPTSIILMAGLSFMDIKFKDYFKFIWKFLLALLVITIVVIVILLHV